MRTGPLKAPPLRFTGGSVLWDSGLADAPLCVAEGVVTGEATGREIDATGKMILPGIVDLHGDGFERHLAPRRGAVTAIEDGLPSLDAELAAHGITTAVLAQFFSWEGGMRGPEFAHRLADALKHYPAACELHMQLRLETHLIDQFEEVLGLIDRAGIGYVVFNDHLPHKALAAGRKPPRLTGQALKSGRSPEAHLALLRRLHDLGPSVPQALTALAEALRERGVHMGSHDDATAQERDTYRALGARIAEFPETRAAAEAAKAAGAAVIMGAPNVVRGGSHDGKVSAAALVADGLVDALVSDYHYPALLRAAFRLADEGLDMAQAWRLISGGPARLLGWRDRGHLAPGARADLIVLDRESRRVEATFVAGQPVYLSGAMARRIVAVTP